jgi:hypothetical protein
MPIPLWSTSKTIYAKVGRIGVLGAATAYFLYRYARGLTDSDFAVLLCSANEQFSAPRFSIPYIAVTAATPLIFAALSVWAVYERSPKIGPRLSIAIKWSSLLIPVLAGVFVGQAHYSEVCAPPAIPLGWKGRWGIWTPFDHLGDRYSDAVILTYLGLCAAPLL